jgi:hypothetical protein
MEQVIIDKKQAEILNGRYGKFSKIEATELKDGNYAIPFACWKDKKLIGFREVAISFVRNETVKKEFYPVNGPEIYVPGKKEVINR